MKWLLAFILSIPMGCFADSIKIELNNKTWGLLDPAVRACIDLALSKLNEQAGLLKEEIDVNTFRIVHSSQFTLKTYITWEALAKRKEGEDNNSPRNGYRVMTVKISFGNCLFFK